MKTYICDLNTDLSQIKTESSDKIYFLTGEPEGNDPMVPLSLLSVLQNSKAKIEYIFTEKGEKLNYIVSMIYAIENSKGYEVVVKTSLINVDPKIFHQVYNAIQKEEVKKAPRKRRTKAEMNTDSSIKTESIEKKEEKDIMPSPVLSDESDDDLDAFMDYLNSLNSELISHMGNIVEAARLSNKEKIDFEEAIRKTVGYNGDKVIEYIGKKNIKKVYEEAIKIKD